VSLLTFVVFNLSIYSFISFDVFIFYIWFGGVCVSVSVRVRAMVWQEQELNKPRAATTTAAVGEEKKTKRTHEK